MHEVRAMERLRGLLPAGDETPEELLAAQLEEAGAWLLAVTRRQSLPPGLVGAQVRLALLGLNRQGIEGESVHDAGGVRRQMEALPGDILRAVEPYIRTKDVMRCVSGSGTSET